MTKTEARAWIRRVREDLRDIEAALLSGDAEALVEAARDGAAALSEIEAAVTGVHEGETAGIGGILSEEANRR